MGRKFVLKKGKEFHVLPGAGVVKAGEVLEGNEFARFVPGILEEVSADTVAPVKKAVKKAAKTVKVAKKPAKKAKTAVKKVVKTVKKPAKKAAKKVKKVFKKVGKTIAKKAKKAKKSVKRKTTGRREWTR